MLSEKPVEAYHIAIELSLTMIKSLDTPLNEEQGNLLLTFDCAKRGKKVFGWSGGWICVVVLTFSGVVEEVGFGFR